MNTHEAPAPAVGLSRLDSRVPFVELVAPFQHFGECIAETMGVAVSAIRRQWARTTSAVKLRRTVAELESLDDFMLRDIGMTRAEIRSIAQRAVDMHYKRQGVWYV